MATAQTEIYQYVAATLGKATPSSTAIGKSAPRRESKPVFGYSTLKKPVTEWISHFKAPPNSARKLLEINTGAWAKLLMFHANEEVLLFHTKLISWAKTAKKDIYYPSMHDAYVSLRALARQYCLSTDELEVCIGIDAEEIHMDYLPDIILAIRFAWETCLNAYDYTVLCDRALVLAKQAAAGGLPQALQNTLKIRLAMLDLLTRHFHSNTTSRLRARSADAKKRKREQKLSSEMQLKNPKELDLFCKEKLTEITSEMREPKQLTEDEEKNLLNQFISLLGGEDLIELDGQVDLDGLLNEIQPDPEFDLQKMIDAQYEGDVESNQ